VISSRRELVAPAIAAVMASMWAALFAWLAVQRHLAGGSHAEDLGFTDQVMSNFLRGQWFRMSIYEGASWNTELDVGRILRPDSLLAFHFEPMLLLLVPPYALGGGMTVLLIVQALAVAAGAMPAYRLGHAATGSPGAGLAVAAAYLLSPLGQWAALADFHTATLAGPLLVLAVERLSVAKSPPQALLAAGLAALAREDVGIIVAALGVVVLMRGRSRPTGLALVGLGLSTTMVGVLVVRTYSGSLSPFEARYEAIVGGGLATVVAALGRPSVLSYLETLALSGGWLGLLSPLALVPAVPSLALNVLSTSPWMMAGKAHYSSLVLPVVAIGAAAGLQRLRNRKVALQVACAGLVLTSLAGYVRAGAGPLGGNYAEARPTAHAARAAVLAASIPAEAAISASSPLVPRVSQRPRVYLFPAVLDADYVFIDVHASPAPTSSGDVFLRLAALLSNGGWLVEAADDGLLLLRREPGAPATDIASLSSALSGTAEADADASGVPDAGGAVSLLSATLEPSPDGASDVDGPRWILRTVWRANQSLPPRTRVEFWLNMSDGEQRHVWDVAPLWWNPPERWDPGRPVAVDIAAVPVKQFVSWRAVWLGL
jgi:uncharacterized membrane protein